MQNRLSRLLTTALGSLLCGCTMEIPLLDHSLRTADNQCLRTEEAQRIYNDICRTTRPEATVKTWYFSKAMTPSRYGTKPRRPPKGRCRQSISNCATLIIRKDKNGEPFCITTHSSGDSDSGFGGSGNSGGSDNNSDSGSNNSNNTATGTTTRTIIRVTIPIDSIMSNQR